MEIEELIKMLIPEDRQNKIMKIKDVFIKGDFEEIFKKYKEELGLLNSFDDVSEFIEEVEEQEIGLDTLIVWYMTNDKLLLELDWSGEKIECEVQDFINYILREIYSEKFLVNADEIYEIFNNDNLKDKPDIKRGEHLNLLFKHINGQLAEYGYKIINFDTNSDEYFIGVFKSEILEMIKKVDVENIKFIDISEMKL